MSKLFRGAGVGIATAALLAGVLPTGAGAAAAAPDLRRTALDLTAARALLASAPAMPAPALFDPARQTRADDCYGVGRPTSGRDGTTMDVATYGMSYGCDPAEDYWLFALGTHDRWATSEFYATSVHLDSDRNRATGCDGIDAVALAARGSDAAINGGVIATPACDNRTWSVVGGADFMRSADDNLFLAFNNSDLGNPTSFDWFAYAESMSDTTGEFLPVSGLHTESGYLGQACTPTAAGWTTTSTAPGLEDALRAAGGTGIRKLYGGVWHVDGDLPALQAALTSVDAGARWEPDVLQTLHAVPNDPSLPEQWGLSQVRAEQAWDVTQGSRDVVVAVVDSGVDATHPELAGQLLPGFDAARNAPLGGGNSDPDGHGTAVAGVVAAVTDNAAGLASLGQRTRVLPIKVVDAAGNISASSLAAGVRYAADNGARVLNVSLGSCVRVAVEENAVRYAQGRGLLVVAASGNEALEGNAANYPAALPDVLAVGATTRQGTRAAYSNTGSYVDLVAPGGDGTADAQTIAVLRSGGGQTSFTGTSFSAPLTAAAAALLLARDPAQSAATLSSVLTRTARDLGPAGRDNETGAGVLDAAAAVGQVAARTNPAPTTAPSPAPAQPGPSASPAPVAPATPRLRTSTGALVHGGTLGVSVQSQPGVVVELLAQSPASAPARVLRTATADSSGRAAFRLQPSASTRFTARARRDSTASPASAAEDVAVAPRVSGAATRRAALSYRLSGGISTGRSGVTVVVNVRRADGSLAALGTTRTGSNGRWTLDKRFAKRGAVVLVVTTRGDSLNRGGRSAPFRVDVR